MLYLGALKMYSLFMETADFNTAAQRWASTPLITAFLIVPLAFSAVRISTVPVSAHLTDTAETALWLVLCGLGAVASMFLSAQARPRRSIGLPLAGTGAFLAAAVLLFLFAAPLLRATAGLYPYLYEAKPLIFFMFACAWAATFGLPDRATIQRVAAWLGGLAVCDAAQALFRQSPERFLGNTDVLATLLLVGLCAGLRSREADDEEQHPALRPWIMLGLLATLSRTGLFTAAWIYAFFGPGSTWKRLPYVTLCAVAVAGSLLLEAHWGLGGVRFMEYWVWLECFQQLAEPGKLLTGFALHAPVPIVPPLDIMSLWQVLFPTSPLDGLYVQQIPAFWIRSIMAWGLVPAMTFLALLFSLLMKRPTRFGAGLTAVCISQGISTTLFYSPGPAITLFLALMLAFRSGNK